MPASPTQQYLPCAGFCFLRFQLPWSTSVIKYYTENSRKKQFIRFTLCAILRSVMQSCASQLHPAQDVNHPFVQRICTEYTTRLLVLQEKTQCIGSSILAEVSGIHWEFWSISKVEKRRLLCYKASVPSGFCNSIPSLCPIKPGRQWWLQQRRDREQHPFFFFLLHGMARGILVP